MYIYNIYLDIYIYTHTHIYIYTHFHSVCCSIVTFVILCHNVCSPMLFTCSSWPSF